MKLFCLTCILLLCLIVSVDGFTSGKLIHHKLNVNSLPTLEHISPHKPIHSTSNNRLQSTALFATKAKIPRKTLSLVALLSYISATSVQFSLVVGFLHLLERAVKGVGSLVDSSNLFAGVITGTNVQTAIVSLFFLFMSVKSRVFSPLDNSRPRADPFDPRFRNRVRPSWMPKPKMFPIIWSTIGLLRTISSVLIWQTTGSLLCVPIFSLMGHLCIGDTWNTINNVENRLGTAFLGVNFVLASVVFAVYQYYLTLPLAGKILAPSAVWLTIAYFLVLSIWHLNFELFEYPSLLPSREEGPPSPWRMPFTSLSK